MPFRDREPTELPMYVLTLAVVVVGLKPEVVGSVQAASE
jgi:hypothetical protein